MSQPTSSYDKRRVYANERYIRSEHLLHGGRFVAVTWTIKEVVYDCPAKRMGAKAGEDATSKMPGIEFNEAPGYLLGLCKTNESMLCMVTGEGHPAKWSGKKVQLVVRLIRDRKTKTDIPAIRVWSEHPIHLGRVMDQMGRRVDDEWYAANTLTEGATTTPAEPPATPPAKTAEPSAKQPPPANHDAEVTALLSSLDKVTDQAGLDALSPEVARLWKLIDKPTGAKISEKAKSSTSVIALPVRKLRMFSSSRTRATESPTRRAWNQASGRLTRWRNSRAPSSTSMRLVVWLKT